MRIRSRRPGLAAVAVALLVGLYGALCICWLVVASGAPVAKLAAIAGLLAIAGVATWRALAIGVRRSGREPHRSSRVPSAPVAAHGPVRVDELTGLANRFELAVRARAALADASATGLVAVVLCDLDGFKDVNDSFGYGAGDELLAEVGRRVAACAPDSTVARVGADEFAVLMGDVDRLERAAGLGEAIRRALQDPYEVHGSTTFLSASVGVAGAGRAQMDFDGLMRNVDVALDEAKRVGRGSLTVFDRRLGEAFRDRATLRGELAAAIDGHEFFLEFQPILDTATEQAAGVEALLRWNHPRRGVLYPDSFLPVAEASGAIIELGAWVLRESLAALARWRAEVGVPAERIWVAVNVSARQFAVGGLFAEIAEALRESGLPPSALRIEITESSLIDCQVASATLEELRRLGVSLEIDDFGTGYSSLGYLKHLPIDALKLDRTFISGIGRDGYDTAIVAAIVSLAHSLGLEVVAEGVESAMQLEHLRGLGCDEVQGFLCSRPLSPIAVAEWLVVTAPATEAR